MYNKVIITRTRVCLLRLNINVYKMYSLIKKKKNVFYGWVRYT